MFIKENKPKSFPVTNQEGSKKIHAKVLKTPAKKEGSKKAGLISQDKNRNNITPKRPNRYLQIFLGHCYSCNNFGHKALNCRTEERFLNTRRCHQVIDRREIRIFLQYSKHMT